MVEWVKAKEDYGPDGWPLSAPRGTRVNRRCWRNWGSILGISKLRYVCVSMCIAVSVSLCVLWRWGFSRGLG